MNSISRYFFLYIILTKSLILISANPTDTTINQNTPKLNKFSIEFKESIFSIMKYSFPNYKNLNPPNTGCTKCADEEKRNYLSYLYGDNLDITARYAFSKNISLKFGIRHIHEEIPIGNYNHDYKGDTLIINSIGFLKNRYFGIPLSVALRTSNTKSGRSYSAIEMGFNFDVIYYEIQTNGSESVSYLITPPTGPSYYQSISRIEKPINPRENKFNFNKVSPFTKIYFEWFNKSQTTSFILGSAFEFQSVYQIDNTAEFYKGYKITPVYIGFSHQFK